MAKSGKSKALLRSTIVRYHRWIGLLSFVVLIVIAVTGIVLNHNVRFGLDEKRVSGAWVMRCYGMEPEGEPLLFSAGDHRVAGWDGALFLDDVMLEAQGQLVGVVVAGDEVSLVCADAIYIVGADGELIEKVGAAMLPEAPVEGAGATAGGAVMLRAGGGVFRMVTGLGSEAIEEGSAGAIEWSEPGLVGEAGRARLAEAFRGGGLPLSRVLLDLHSGKFFGNAGVVIYDLAAVAAILLSLSGVWLAVRNFYRSGRNRRPESSKSE